MASFNIFGRAPKKVTKAEKPKSMAESMKVIDDTIKSNEKREAHLNTKIMQQLKLAKEIPIVKKGLGKLDEATINLRKNLLASIRGDRILPDGPILKSEQTERMATGFKENIDKIPKKNRAPDADFTRTKVDEFARVTKHKIRKYVEKYGGSAVDLERIFKEYTTKHHSALNAKAWLNKYWKDLNKGIGQGGLKNARLKIVDGKLQIVDGRTKKTIEHPFELDHSKAKELMHELGLEGADMSDNLNIVYSIQLLSEPIFKSLKV